MIDLLINPNSLVSMSLASVCAGLVVLHLCVILIGVIHFALKGVLFLPAVTVVPILHRLNGCFINFAGCVRVVQRSSSGGNALM